MHLTYRIWAVRKFIVFPFLILWLTRKNADDAEPGEFGYIHSLK